MKPLIASVKDSALIKWPNDQHRWKTIKEAREWWRDIGCKKCSFCDYFTFYRSRNGDFLSCICPIHDPSTCAKEYKLFENAIYDNDLAAANAASYALHLRIAALPVEE